MAQDVSLKQRVLQTTLQEVSQDADHGDANPCVICLDQVEEVAIALPCRHESFDFICLVSWLGQRPACPLCQAEVTGVKYDIHSPQGPKIYTVPPSASRSDPLSSAAGAGQRYPGPRSRPRRRPYRRLSPPQEQPGDDPLVRRRRIYRQELYSQRVGTNRLSRYREITPQIINSDEDLVSRARKWIRRELQVFEFLNPDVNSNARDGDGAVHLRANNAEFLLEYIVAVLRTVDIKGSGGQAEELLQEFLGRANARLFLHELHAWLRSPYNSLEDWDRAVQYDEAGDRLRSMSQREGDQQVGHRGNTWSPSRYPGIAKSRTHQRRPDSSRWRRIQSAQRRYMPD